MRVGTAPWRERTSHTCSPWCRVPLRRPACCVQSVLGSFLDPVADKVLIGSVTVTLGVQGLLPPALVALIVARDACLMAGVAVIRWRTKPPGVPYFSLSGPNVFEISPSTTSKARVCVYL